MNQETVEKIIGNVLWIGSICIGLKVAEITHNIGKKIIEHVYKDIILKQK